MKQPDERLRALNSEPAKDGPREEVYCAKVRSRFPNEMYIIGAHMDGHGWGEAANDNGSGTALVMELARIFSMPDVVTDRTIRFALWNNEETGLNGARAYVEQRQPLGRRRREALLRRPVAQTGQVADQGAELVEERHRGAVVGCVRHRLGRLLHSTIIARCC